MVVLHGQRLFDWKSFTVTDRSAKTTKPLHLEQSAMFGSYSNNSDISNVQFSNAGLKPQLYTKYYLIVQSTGDYFIKENPLIINKSCLRYIHTVWYVLTGCTTLGVM